MANRDPGALAIPDGETRIIKRYSNRKLYDTLESRYVTLDEISQMVKDGAEVRIVDNRNQADLTSVTLAQIILEEEKRASHTPLTLLRDIVRGGGERLHAFVTDELEPRVHALRTEAEQAVAKVFRKGAKEGDLASVPEEASSREPSALGQARAFVRASRQSLEEWQQSLDEKMKEAMQSFVGLPSLHREVQALRDKLLELEKKLNERGRE